MSRPCGLIILKNLRNLPDHLIRGAVERFQSTPPIPPRKIFLV
jgi:hypothetical protein